MIQIEDILELHRRSIEDYGGSYGIRDADLLASAIVRPYQSFDGMALYPTLFEKAAAIGQSLIGNHPFVDGNKRIGTLTMISLLNENGYIMTALPENLYTFVINIATSSISFEEIVEWLRENTKENL